MATTDMGDMQDRNRLDRAQRGGSIGLVLLIAVVLVGAAIGLLQVGRGNTSLYILILLAILGTVGVFSLFALASGILRFSGQETGDPLIKGLVDGAFDGILVTNASGRVLYANDAYVSLIGASNRSEVRPIERVFIGDPDVSETVYRLLKAAREGRRLQEEVRVSGQKGEPGRWLRMRVRPGGTGRYSRSTVWTVADVTRDREKQENVFQELQHAIDYLDHAPAGFFSVDAAGNIVYLNATLANWLGQDLAEVGSGGLKLADVVSGEGASLLALPPSPGEVVTEVLDLDFKTRSGRSVPVRLFHKVAFGADGTPGTSRTLVLNRARGEKQDAQRAAEVRFMRFFNNTPMAIATVDRSGRIVRSNALFARLFKSVSSGASGRSILETVSERDRNALEAAIAKAGQGQGDIDPVEAALSEGTDRSATFFVTATDDDSDRDSESAIIYALDNTERLALENQIKQQQKMDTVGQLAGGIAHDFNNVLSAIMMATDFLLSAHKPTDPSFSDIMQIKQNANRAAALVRQLLAFSRRQTLRPQVLDLGEVLSDLGILLKRLIGEKVKLDVVHGRDLWAVKADLSQFEQVIVNLAVNARDAMPEGGKLTVRTSNLSASDVASAATKGLPVADYVAIEVTDSGTGMTPDVMTQIFEPFFSTKEVGKGTGLGLSTVYGIVKQTGGFIFVDSELGKGSTFRICLPRHIADKEEAKSGDASAIAALAAANNLSQVAQGQPPQPQRSADLTGHGTVLLVEDEEGLRALNARGLTSRGYTVLTAGNGVEALEELQRSEGKVDIVVSDVVMPEMDGPTLLKEMRKTNPELKMIFVSGYAEDAFQKNMPAGEQFAFLPKPFTLKQLVEAVKDTLAK